MEKIFVRAGVLIVLSTLFTMLSTERSAVLAQAPPYIDTQCGSWVNDVWVPNGNCTPDDPGRRHAAVAGQITSVNGNMVTVSQSNGSILINDQPALDRQQTGRVAVGRQIVAYGYWLGGTFYATGIY